MKRLTFNSLSFLLTLVFFILLSAGWSILCIATDEFTNRDKGFVSGLGFLLLPPLAIFLGQRPKGIQWLLFLVGCMLLIFLLASFAIGLLIAATTDSMVIYAIVNSLFVATATTFCLNKAVGIQFKRTTILSTFLCLLAAYALIDRYDEQLFIDHDIPIRVTLFNVFQLLLLVPLAVGMNVRKRGVG
jgi:uncharacterized membrane protein